MLTRRKMKRRSLGVQARIVTENFKRNVGVQSLTVAYDVMSTVGLKHSPFDDTFILLTNYSLSNDHVIVCQYVFIPFQFNDVFLLTVHSIIKMIKRIMI